MKLCFVWPGAMHATYDVANGLHQALEAQGHELIDYQLSNRMALHSYKLVEMAPNGMTPDPFDVALLASEALTYRVIFYGCRWVLIVNGQGLHPNVVLTLKQAGIKIAAWFTEGPYETNEDAELQLAQFCEVVFTNERTSVPLFQSIQDRMPFGGRTYPISHAYNPAVHRPYNPDTDEPLTDDEKSDVLLVGTGFAERQALFEAIDWTGINLKLAGMWLGVKPPSHLAKYLIGDQVHCLDNSDTARLYRGTKIVLNPHRFHPTAESSNPRTFEAAACGAFQIGDYRAETAEIFGDSIPMFQPGVPWQLASLIRKYLADDAARARRVQAAIQLVTPHTFDARARTIVSGIEEASLDIGPERTVSFARR